MKVGKVSKWYKNEGDSVEKGGILFEVETEKITNKIESPESGLLFQIVVPQGTIVAVGTILAVIAQAGEKPERIEGFKVGEVVEIKTGKKNAPGCCRKNRTSKRETNIVDPCRPPPGKRTGR